MTFLDDATVDQATVLRWNHAVIPVTSRLGLHSRPSMVLCDILTPCPGEVYAARSDKPGDSPSTEYIDAKSILHLQLLGLSTGSALNLRYEIDSPQIRKVIEIVPKIFRWDDEEKDLEKMVNALYAS